MPETLVNLMRTYYGALPSQSLADAMYLYFLTSIPGGGGGGTIYFDSSLKGTGTLVDPYGTDVDYTPLITPSSTNLDASKTYEIPIYDMTDPLFPLGRKIALNLAQSLIIGNRVTDSYTLVMADAGKEVEANKATAIVITVPLNATVAFPVGTVISVLWYGVGATSIAAAGGVTINKVSTTLNLSVRYATVLLRKTGTNEWNLSGSLT